MHFEFFGSIDEMIEVKAGRAFKISFFLEAPNKKTIVGLVNKGVIEKVDGNCAGDTPLSEIQIGVRQKFKAGDPIVFWGTPLEVTKYPYNPSTYLKIRISDDVFFYSFISPYLYQKCFYLQPI